MKSRFLNLGHFAVGYMTVLAVLLLVIPLAGWGMAHLGLDVSALAWVVRASLYTGAALLVIFVVLIVLEQVLDARLYHQYRKTLARRIPLGDGYAECPACGFRQLRDFDSTCPSCGKALS